MKQAYQQAILESAKIGEGDIDIAKNNRFVRPDDVCGEKHLLKKSFQSYNFRSEMCSFFNHHIRLMQTMISIVLQRYSWHNKYFVRVLKIRMEKKYVTL